MIQRVVAALVAASMVFISATASASSYKSVTCPFSAPSGERVECGVVQVSENRLKNTPKQIQIFVTRIKSYSQLTKVNPIVYLTDDPKVAVSTLLAQGKIWSETAPFRSDRELILIDWRGSGQSKPVLSCDEVKPLSQTEDEFLQAVQDCHNRLTKNKIDVSAYNTREIAQDVNDVMRELDFKQWNILAVGYGSEVAQVLMQLQPEGIRSVVLNSVTPLSPVTFLDKGVNAKRVFDRLFYDCGVDPLCRKNYPNIKDVYVQMIRSLPNVSQKAVTANMAMRDIAEQLANTNMIGLMPEMIFNLAHLQSKGELQRDQFFKILKLRSENHRDEELGLGYSITCNDNGLGLEKRYSVNKKGTSFPYYPDVRNDLVCNIWQRGNALAPYVDKPTKPLPMLIFSGEYDSAANPDWGRQLAKVISGAKFFQFKGVGSDVVSTSLCARFMAKAFFDRPDHRVEDVCTTALKSPQFFAPEQNGKKPVAVAGTVVPPAPAL